MLCCLSHGKGESVMDMSMFQREQGYRLCLSVLEQLTVVADLHGQRMHQPFGIHRNTRISRDTFSLKKVQFFHVAPIKIRTALWVGLILICVTLLDT